MKFLGRACKMKFFRDRQKSSGDDAIPWGDASVKIDCMNCVFIIQFIPDEVMSGRLHFCQEPFVSRHRKIDLNQSTRATCSP